MGLEEEVGRVRVCNDVSDEETWFVIAVIELSSLIYFFVFDGWVCGIVEAGMVSLYDYDEGDAKLGVVIGRSKVFVGLMDGRYLVSFADFELVLADSIAVEEDVAWKGLIHVPPGGQAFLDHGLHVLDLFLATCL